jgi:4-hydroxybenzoate polyprenyltransferase
MDLVTFLAIIGGVAIAEKLLKEAPMVLFFLAALIDAVARALNDAAARADKEERKVKSLTNEAMPDPKCSSRLADRAEEPPDEGTG